MVIGILGVLKAGGAYVPLDPEYPQERLGYMLEDSGIAVLLSEEKVVGKLPAQWVQEALLDSGWEETAGRESAEAPGVGIDARQLAYVIYTSGSTGRPKGVMIPHGGLANLLAAMGALQIVKEPDVLVAITTFSFDIAALELLLPLLTGARLVIASPNTVTSPILLETELLEQGATVMQATPATWQALTTSTNRSYRAIRALSGGDALSRHLAAELLERTAGVWNLYGPTETTIWSTAARLRDAGGSIHIGRPVLNTLVYILDAELQPAPMGTPGESYIAGEGLARGYWRQPERTAEKFLPDPFAGRPGRRMYRTGDLARWLPSRELELLGRLDHQVKILGHRIETGEIEMVLDRHPAVYGSAVVAQQEGDNLRLTAFVVPRNGATPAAAELRAHLELVLPKFMIPSVFVMLDRLPLTLNGKVDRKQLAALRAAKPLPGPSSQRTPTEEILAGILEDVLQISEVGRQVDFFELGGHSLHAMQALSRIRRSFDLDIPLREFFELSTVANLARRVNEFAGRAVEDPAPLVSASRNIRAPLSFAQERLWFLRQLEPHSSAYHLPLYVRFSGPLDIRAVRGTLNEIVRRHEVLRTNFVVDEGSPYQRIASAMALQVNLVDLEALNGCNAVLVRIAEAEYKPPFNFESGPILRARLVRLSKNEHVLLLTIHHVATDDWSNGILLSEFSAIYRAFASEQQSPLPNLPVQYADFAAWQRRWLTGERLEGQLAYWRRQLDGLQTLELPIDRTRHPLRSYQGAIHMFAFGPELSKSLKDYGRKHGLTPFMLLAGLFQLLLARYTGQEDIAIGAAIAGRHRVELEGLIGFFVNQVVLRTKLGGNPSFHEYMERVREITLGAYAHQDLPFDELVADLMPDRDLARSPLFQTLITFQNAPKVRESIPGVRMEMIELRRRDTTFDLVLNLVDGPLGIRGTLQYAEELFEAATIERLAAHCRALTESGLANPGCRVFDLPMLSAAEQKQCVLGCNDTARDSGEARRLHRWIEEQAARTPAAVAVACGSVSLTYGELEARSTRLAHELVQLEISANSLVGICLPRRPYAIVAILAVLKAGGAYVPVDPEQPRERLDHMVSAVRVLVTQMSLADSLKDVPAKLLFIDAPNHGFGAALPGKTALSPDSGATLENTLYAIFSSGSTGCPKAAGVSHRSYFNLLAWYIRELGINAGERILLLSSLNFDLTQKNIFAPLVSGATLVFPEVHYYDPEAIRRTVLEQAITLINCTPSAFYAIADPPDPRELACLASLRKLVLGGEMISLRRLGAWRESGFFGAELINSYGPTECTDVCSFHRLPADWQPNDAVVPIGRSIDNTQIFVLGKHLELLPIGAIGEIYIQGVPVGEGYVNSAARTAEKFLPAVYGPPGVRMYRTGDLGKRLPDGGVLLIGRTDDQVKIRGFRIELGEIESALSQHPAIGQVAVQVRGDGAGGQALVAYAAPRPGATLDPDGLRAYARMKLPDYMAPYAFVCLDVLPLTTNGKLDRKALSLYGLPRPKVSYVAPRTEIEERLAAIWAELLRVERVGINDNFFELGGHSLLLTRIAAWIQMEFGIELPLQVLFTTHTIEAMVGAMTAYSLEQESELRREEILRQIAALSPGEVDTLLASGGLSGGGHE
jgi:amino acid adenylation domain-containing protein